MSHIFNRKQYKDNLFKLLNSFVKVNTLNAAYKDL